MLLRVLFRISMLISLKRNIKDKKTRLLSFSNNSYNREIIPNKFKNNTGGKPFIWLNKIFFLSV